MHGGNSFEGWVHNFRRESLQSFNGPDFALSCQFDKYVVNQSWLNLCRHGNTKWQGTPLALRLLNVKWKMWMKRTPTTVFRGKPFMFLHDYEKEAAPNLSAQPVRNINNQVQWHLYRPPSAVRRPSVWPFIFYFFLMLEGNIWLTPW